ncbi:TonB-dependent receptor [Lysobacter pythonis]|uniref:TonB-dependent receptor n=1 Tax=Solilutibacter pythonis TaxID=2483112 RepID=A0A3M2I0G4_9GAMM|nr:TonB-dependent receptor [Lysobacter pythonis]RMH93875.1 TonB-dependent receptor [Lysobacter pythonis]
MLRFSPLFTSFLLLGTSAAAAEPPADDTASPKTLDRVVVKGRVQTHYKVEETKTATRTDTPLELVPQSVQVITRQLIEDQAASDVTDLYRNISGVSYFSYSGVTMRGFRQENVLYDGLRGDPYEGFSVPRLFSVNEVQALKGSTGAIYGDGEPGGVINYTSKKPSAVTRNVAKLKLGNYDSAAGSLEASGPIRDGRLRYRLGGYADSERTWRYNTARRARIGEAGFAADIGENSDLLVQVTGINQYLKGSRLRGVKVDENGGFLTTTRWTATEPSDFLDHRAQAVFARFTSEPSYFFSFNAAMRWFRTNERLQNHEPRELAADGRTVLRQFFDQDRRIQGLSFNANSIFRFTTGPANHTLLFGVENFRRQADMDLRRADSRELGKGLVPGIDLYDPVYGLSSAADYDLKNIRPRFTRANGLDQGLYLQDQIELSPRWHVLAGLRRDRYVRDDQIARSKASGGDLTWRFGLTHVATTGLNVYFNTSTGFRPQSINAHSPLVGGPFDPQRSRQWELGFKARPEEGRMQFNGALYRIDRTNLLQSTGLDPGNDGFQDLAALGLVRSEGFEMDLLADLTPRWVLNLSYSYNDARILSGSAAAAGNATALGSRRFANAPRHNLGAWTRLDIPSLKSAVGFGAEYMSERLNRDGERVKPYTLFDISWQTRRGKWEWQANIKNLFNKEYAASGFSRFTGHLPGEPRRLLVETRYQF